jgi:hypothetical protein
LSKPKQLQLDYRPWGGKRKGAGRKRASPLPRVPHASRSRHSGRVPVHVTLRLRRGLPSLRTPLAHEAVLRALVEGSASPGFAVVHYSAMSNHLHLICEAGSKDALRWGVSALVVRLARALNRVWRRRGPVFADRFHSCALPTPREVRNRLAYVLQNAQHHGILRVGEIDPYSSGPWFDGWIRGPENPVSATAHHALPHARTWLLALGWKRGGLLDPARPPTPHRTVRRRTESPIGRSRPRPMKLSGGAVVAAR